ncbi:hypothetical protein [Sphingomonas montanisoli]|uniref:hypothetical protein n=1 Tax=Sphingomonas montanisoli TaxID=2606412 RepID=UPI0011F21278|nr:hypothetical protein [Sphingomonas montanisoli]
MITTVGVAGIAAAFPDDVTIATSGGSAHGIVLQHGARVAARDTDVGVTAAALYVLGDVGPASIANLANSGLANAGPTIGAGGQANIDLTNTVVGAQLGSAGLPGGNVQRLLVGTSADFPLLAPSLHSAPSSTVAPIAYSIGK